MFRRYNLTAAKRAWVRAPVDGLGYTSTEEMLAWSDARLKDAIRRSMVARFGPGGRVDPAGPIHCDHWHNAGNLWVEALTPHYLPTPRPSPPTTSLPLGPQRPPPPYP